MNRKLKQALSVLLCFCMVFGSVAISSESIGEFFGSISLKVFAEDTSGSCGENATWSFDSTSGTLKISGTGAMTNYTDSTLQPWSAYADSITSLYIGSGITSVGSHAFENCSALTEAYIASSVTALGENAFADCIVLKTISPIKKLQSIGAYAFSGCTSLTEYIVPLSVTSIGNGAFADCDNISVAVFENELTIAADAFDGCENATIYTPIDSTASFYTGDVFTDMGDAELNFKLNSDGESYTVVGTETKTVTTVIVPSVYNGKAVTAIAALAFAGCKMLTKIFVPDSVTKVGRNAVYDTALKASFTSGVVTASGIVFNCLSNSGACTIPVDTRVIADYAFSEKLITEVTFPDGIETVGEYAFYKCENMYAKGTEMYKILTGDENRNYHTNTGGYYEDTKTNTIIYKSEALPNLVYLGDYAFYGCKDLAGFTITENLREMGEHSFGENDGIYELIRYLEDTTDYFGYVFYTFYVKCPADSFAVKILQKSKIQMYMTEDNLTYSFTPDFSALRLIAVEDLTTRADLVIPEKVAGITVTEIGNSLARWNMKLMYAWCMRPQQLLQDITSVKSIYMPDTIVSIGTCAFTNFVGVTSIHFSENLKKIGDGAFDMYNYTGSLVITSLPDSVEYIGVGAFDYSIQIALTKLPASLEYFGYQAFNEKSDIMIKIAEDTADNSFIYIGKTLYAVKGKVSGDVVDLKDDTKYISKYVSEYHYVNGEYTWSNSSVISVNELILPEGLIGIDSRALYKGIKKVNIPKSIEWLGYNVFYKMTFDRVFLPNLKWWRGGVFSQCTINALILPEKLESKSLMPLWNSYNLGNVKDLTTLRLPSVEILSGFDGENDTYSSTIKNIYIGEGTKIIGHNAFAAIQNLERVFIPESVEIIDSKAFQESSTTFTIYCKEGSYAHSYAVANGYSYVFWEEFDAPDDIDIDYDDEVIYTDKKAVTDILDILLLDPDDISSIPSMESESGGIYGTGSEIYLANESISGDFTLVVSGDVNGDGVCDVLDACLTERAMNEHETFTKYQKAAITKRDFNTEVLPTDYQTIVNKVLSQ